MIRFENICFHPVLHRLNFSLESEHIHAIMGETGSGKTTLLRILMGFEQPHDGVLYWNDSVISDKRGYRLDRGRSRIFYGGERATILNHLSVRNNLLLGLRMSSHQQSEFFEEIVDLLAIEGLFGKVSESLSGGERQLVSLARVLLRRPAVLLLDEPFSDIDYIAKDTLLERLRVFLQKHKIMTIVITHDRKECYQLADRLLLLHHGVLIQQGSPEDLYRNPESMQAALLTGELIPLGEDLAGVFSLDTHKRYIGVRPENVKMTKDSGGDFVVEDLRFKGHEYNVLLRHHHGSRLVGVCENGFSAQLGDRVRVDLLHLLSWPEKEFP